MDKLDFKKYLDDRYHNQIDWYDRRAITNQNFYKRLQFSLIVLSVLTPVLLLVEKLEVSRGLPWLFWVTAASAVAVAILTSTIKSFRFQERWLHYRTTCETLRKEIHLYRAKAGEYHTALDRESLFVERAEGLISRENTLWLASHKPTRTRKPEKG